MTLWNLEVSPQCCVTELKLKQHCKKCVKSNEALLLGHWPLFHMPKELSCRRHTGPRERRKSLFIQRLFSQAQVDLDVHSNKIQEESLLLLMSKIRVPDTRQCCKNHLPPSVYKKELDLDSKIISSATALKGLCLATPGPN